MAYPEISYYQCSRFFMSFPQEELSLKMRLFVAKMIAHCNSVHIAEQRINCVEESSSGMIKFS